VNVTLPSVFTCSAKPAGRAYPVQPGCDGPNRDVQSLGVVVGQVAPGDQQQHVPVGPAEPADGRDQAPAHRLGTDLIRDAVSGTLDHRRLPRSRVCTVVDLLGPAPLGDLLVRMPNSQGRAVSRAMSYVWRWANAARNVSATMSSAAFGPTRRLAYP
jgi:hypothetical protein